jgi:hypothetical protein
MTVDSNLRRRTLRRALWSALLVALVPALTGAAPPLDAAPLDAPPTAAALADGARQPRARSGNARIGRVFFSPAERQRRRSAKDHPATDAPNTNDLERRQRWVINGAVSSSTQGRAVWVNGAAIENSDKLKSVWTDRGGTVWLRDDRRIPRRVRPGQAIDPASGAIQDLLPAGSVTRR